MYANFEIMYAHQKLILDKRRPKKENLYPAKIRITHQRIQKYYAAGIDLSEIDFERISNNSVRKELRSAKKKVLLFQSKVQNVEKFKIFFRKELSKHQFTIQKFAKLIGSNCVCKCLLKP